MPAVQNSNIGIGKQRAPAFSRKRFTSVANSAKNSRNGPYDDSVKKLGKKAPEEEFLSDSVVTDSKDLLENGGFDTRLDVSSNQLIDLHIKTDENVTGMQDEPPL